MPCAVEALGELGLEAGLHLDGRAVPELLLAAGLLLDVLAADALAGVRAGDLGLVALAVVLQTPGPLAVTALVMSSIALRSIFTNLRLESIGISVKTLFDGPIKSRKMNMHFKMILNQPLSLLLILQII